MLSKFFMSVINIHFLLKFIHCQFIAAIMVVHRDVKDVFEIWGPLGMAG